MVLPTTFSFEEIQPLPLTDSDTLCDKLTVFLSVRELFDSVYLLLFHF